MDVAVGPCAAIKVGCRVGACGCLNRDAIAGQQTTERCPGDVATAGGDGEVHRVNQPCAGLSIGCGGSNFYIVGDLHVGGAGLDKAAVAAMGGACIKLAANHDAVIDHAAHQVNSAFFAAGQCLRLDHACVVDHRAGQLTCRLGRQVHQPAIGLDGATVLNQRVNRALRHLQLHRPTQVQRHLATRAQQHVATVGRQRAVVGDLGCNQRNRATVDCCDIALVDDGIAAGACELVAACHEVSRAQAEG